MKANRGCRAWLGALLIAALPATLTPADAAPIEVRTEPLALHTQDAAVRQVGSLVYRGGLVLASPEAAFGGFSALGVSADGRRLIAIGDRGRRLFAYLIYNENGDLAGLHRPELDSLAGLDGQPLEAKSESDAEAMSPGVEGEIIVAFERRHRLWRYLPDKTLPEPLPPPDGLAALPANSGIEALALLSDGRLLAITEGRKDVASALAWVSDTDGWSPLTYPTDGEFRPTGAATLPDGDVLVLERRFTLRGGVAARLQRLPAAGIAPGGDLKPTLIAELRPPISVDNFEGVAVRAGEDGGVYVYIISDDNFNPLQRTLLMMFEMRE